MISKEIINYDIQRKIVSNMTTESWQNIPHATYIYEPDITEFLEEYDKLKNETIKDTKITVNTLMIRTIVEGLKSAPLMNAHLSYNHRFVKGKIEVKENIDISVPWIMPDGKMMTVNMKNMQSKSLKDISAYSNEISKKLENTNLTEAMYEVSMDNTITQLKHGRVIKTINRILGAKFGDSKVRLLKGKDKKKYQSIPKTDRITKDDLEPGTITVSNVGSLYRGQRGSIALLEIIPPQVVAIAIGATQEKPTVIKNAKSESEIAIRKVMPLCIAFDHRALDFGEVIPFIKRLDEIFENPKVIHNW